jgi:phage-related tail protein
MARQKKVELRKKTRKKLVNKIAEYIQTLNTTLHFIAKKSFSRTSKNNGYKLS